MSRVIRDKATHKSKGYGFASFMDPFEAVKAMKAMQGKYIGNRPVKITRSKAEDRDLKTVQSRSRKKRKMQKRLQQSSIF